jgi:hypothetical protein
MLHEEVIWIQMYYLCLLSSIFHFNIHVINDVQIDSPSFNVDYSHKSQNQYSQIFTQIILSYVLNI